jgi:alkylhydroperoxidase family enzyme
MSEHAASWPSIAGDPREVFAPEVLSALRSAAASVRATAPGAALELVRLRLATLLGFSAELDAPAWGSPTGAQRAELADWASAESFDSGDRAALALGEQFAIDITGVSGGPLADAAAAHGASVLALVQGVFLLDLGHRCAKALGRLFDTSITSADWAWPVSGDAADEPDAQLVEAPGADPMAAIGELLRVTAEMQTVDPALRELVRMRGAHHHQCRRCQSVRSVAAIDAGLDEAALDAARPGSTLGSGRQQAALALTDAVLVGRVELSDDLVEQIRAELSAAEAVEVVCYLMRNSANKIAVAFGADAAIVSEGFEYQVIDAEGETITVELPQSL